MTPLPFTPSPHGADTAAAPELASSSAGAAANV